MAALEQLGEETWFRLGDSDLAMHVARTRRLAGGESLSQFTEQCCRQLGIATRILPMTDDAVRTRVRTDAGWLDFQDYFVRERCVPAVRELAYHGAETAHALPQVIATLADPGLRAVIICPSNPYLSIAPMLSIPALRAALDRCNAPVVAISPIIGGKAVKGPTAKIMLDLGLDPSARVVAQAYAGLVDVFVADDVDAGINALDGLTTVTTTTLMNTLADREQPAASCWRRPTNSRPNRLATQAAIQDPSCRYRFDRPRRHGRKPRTQYREPGIYRLRLQPHTGKGH